MFDYPNKKGIFITVKSGWLDIEFVLVFSSVPDSIRRFQLTVRFAVDIFEFQLSCHGLLVMVSAHFSSSKELLMLVQA